MWYKPVFVSIHPEVLAEFTDVARACGILQSVRGPCLIDTLLETTVQLIDNENRFETHTHTSLDPSSMGTQKSCTAICVNVPSILEYMEPSTNLQC